MVPVTTRANTFRIDTPRARLPRAIPATRSGRWGYFIEGVAIGPFLLRAGRNLEADIRLRTDRGSNGPENHLVNRAVSLDSDTGSRLAILDPDVVVISRRPEPLELGEHAGPLRQLRGVDELAVAHFREIRAKRLFRF